MRVSAVLACENQPIFYPPSNSYMMCSFRLSPASVSAVRKRWHRGGRNGCFFGGTGQRKPKFLARFQQLHDVQFSPVSRIGICSSAGLDSG